MAPDPYDGSYSFGNPQSLNRYIYASNSPFSYTDGKGAMDENGADSGCEMDGTDQDCGIVYSALQMGAAVECPNDACHGWSGNSIVQFGCNPECSYSTVYTIPDDSNNDVNNQGQQCGGGNGNAPNSAMCKAPNNGECDNACQLAHAFNKTGVYSLTSVCFPAAFYGASAAGATVGVAAANAPEVYAATVGDSATWYGRAISWLNRVVGRTPLGPPVRAMAATAASQASQFCSTH